MCFGSKEKNLYHDDEPPRPTNGQAPQQPTYASVPPKSSVPPTVVGGPSYMQPPQKPRMPTELPSPMAPAELSAGGDDFAPPPGPPPSHRPPSNHHHDDMGPPAGPPPSHRTANNNPFHNDVDSVGPPPGPPPSASASHHPQSLNPFRLNQNQSNDSFAPPPGPPPSHRQQDDYMQPPPGPPPSHHKQQDDDSYMQPPPGPPPAAKKPQHDWESVVPDTALFPPPPSFFSGFDRSPATNATEQEAEAGEAWCKQHPPTPPIHLDAAALDTLRPPYNIRLMEPTPGFRGTLQWKAPGVWSGRTDAQARDSCIIGYPPLYSVTNHSPLASASASKTVYYEVSIGRDGGHGDVCLALGYAALPYPSFRMPGWHRGSLAVHGDDGHKYINDRWGGKDFTVPFKRGETYGIGMTFSVAAGGGRIETNIFFTRQGRETGRWNLHEETDAEQDLPVTGLEGYHDLSCAIGTYTATQFDVIFDPSRWLYKPAGY
ncbi:hypothetical protein B0H66DRAFT_469726 [Apodospora peruviana]|uniref:SPRY domain-containing protein n=1 Tax=Apodospora peruviana TaxID=516989 RepID=A0AAE0MEC4_9PEZI|nr:hypothetical protein B0H66DRAFT_469726 [Apodospora peruviana]